MTEERHFCPKCGDEITAVTKGALVKDPKNDERAYHLRCFVTLTPRQLALGYKDARLKMALGYVTSRAKGDGLHGYFPSQAMLDAYELGWISGDRLFDDEQQVTDVGRAAAAGP